MILLDTHVFLWLSHEEHRVGRKARRLIEHAHGTAQLVVSAISYLEVGHLVAHGRVALEHSLTEFRRAAQSSGILELPVDGAVTILASRLEGLHGDPVDRIIFATALHEKATLVTADSKLLSAKGGPKRIDAQS